MKRALVGIALLLVPTIGAAYVLGSERWPTPAATVHTGRLPPLYANAVAQAAGAWRTATGFNLATDAAVRGSCDVFDGPLLDGVEFANVDCSGVGLGSRTLALTEWYRDDRGNFVEFGITFSSDETWGVYDGPLRFDAVDFRRVALHELGHVIGLDHEPYLLAIMNPAIGDHYTLQTDDLNGVVARYPELRRVRILAPTGQIEDQDPTFRWAPVPGSTLYGFKLEPPGGGIIREYYAAADVGCADGIHECSLRRGGMLVPGPYTFRVYAEANGVAGKWWSQVFTIGGPSLTPGVPTALAPADTVETPTPTFSWTPVTPVTDYRIEIVRPGGATTLYVWYPAGAAGCGAGETTCSVAAPRALADGAHRLRVQGSNGALRGPWSAPLAFRVALLPGKPTLLAPLGTVDTTRPEFVWAPVPRAGSYRLHVRDARGNPIRLDRPPADVGCDDGVSPCALGLGTELPNGTTSVWVQSRNAYGSGPWSDEVRIRVAAPVVLPGATVFLAPAPSVTTRRPEIVWTPASSATLYYVSRRDPAGRVIRADLPAAAAGCAAPDATTCVFVPPADLAFGTHVLYVRGHNVFGNGPWSPELRVRVERPPAP